MAFLVPVSYTHLDVYKRQDMPRVVQVTLPGAARPLALEASWSVLKAGERQPAWTASQSGRGEQWLHFGIGRGQITVATALDDHLSNRHIGERDHAELYWSCLLYTSRCV